MYFLTLLSSDISNEPMSILKVVSRPKYGEVESTQSMAVLLNRGGRTEVLGLLKWLEFVKQSQRGHLGIYCQSLDDCWPENMQGKTLQDLEESS